MEGNLPERNAVGSQKDMMRFIYDSALETRVNSPSLAV